VGKNTTTKQRKWGIIPQNANKVWHWARCCV
jgi:hypothetical protein